MIQAGLGRYGPYLKYQGSFTSLPADDDLLTVGLNRAVDLLAESAKKRGRLLGEHPSGGEVHLKAGRFGPYVEHNKLRATLPRGTEMSELTLEEGIALLTAKAARPAPKKKAAKAGGKKAGAKKSAGKRAPRKKYLPIKRPPKHARKTLRDQQTGGRITAWQPACRQGHR